MHLSDGVFHIFKEIRAEALRLYWSENSFLIVGYVESDIEDAILTIPAQYFTLIRKLVIDTHCLPSGRVGGGYLPRRCWLGPLTLLQQMGNPNIQVEVLFSRKVNLSQYESARYQEDEWKRNSQVDNIEALVKF